MNSFYKVAVNISSLIAFVYCLFVLRGVYSYICLLPLCFFLVINYSRSFSYIWTRRQFTAYVIFTLLWIRMVFLPFYGCISQSYSIGISGKLNSNFIGSVFLCIYDCIAIVLCLAFYELNHTKVLATNSQKSSSSLLYGNKYIYVFFVLFALIIFFVSGRGYHLFDFAVKSIGGGLEREGDITDSRFLIIRQIVTSGMMFLFLLFVNSFHSKYEITKKNKYISFSLIVAVLLISIIVGERRTAQIYTAFATCYVLLTIYPVHRKRIVSVILLAALFVLTMMTVYKQFYGFMYDSYAEAIQNAQLSEGLSYSMVDAYFYGIDTIAKNMQYGNLIESTGISQFLYDFFRSCFGLNVLVSHDQLLTSQMYNSIIYSGDQMTGLLLSSVGYGYIFGGYFLAPIVTIFNVLMMLIFENCLRRSKTIEWQYTFAYLFMRFGFGFLGATPPLINVVTRFLVINGVIILVAGAFKRVS